VAVKVYRCTHCGREVLVRLVAELTDAEIARRLEEERRPAASGERAVPDRSLRLRDDIWVGVSGTREVVPRDDLPERCPACRRPTLEAHRILD
jgi:DNA-directed RNA polymerase subunit RPC12/RpoP